MRRQLIFPAGNEVRLPSDSRVPTCAETDARGPPGSPPEPEAAPAQGPGLVMTHLAFISASKYESLTFHPCHSSLLPAFYVAVSLQSYVLLLTAKPPESNHPNKTKGNKTNAGAGLPGGHRRPVSVGESQPSTGFHVPL